MNKLWMAAMICISGLFALSGCATDAATPGEVTAKCNTIVPGETADPGLACYKAEGSLPTAVQFGDSVSKGYGIAARHDLCGVVDYRHDGWDSGDIDLCGNAYNPYNEGAVIKAGNNNGYSATLLSAMEQSLNRRHFNVVLFNSGYHDIQHHVALPVYLRRIEAAAQTCEQSADICIWVDTPDLDADSLTLDGDTIDQSAVITYNATARSVVKDHGFYMLSMSGTGHDGTVHFTSQGYAAGGSAVADCVLAALSGEETDSCHK